MDKVETDAIIKRAESAFSSLLPRYKSLPSFWLGRSVYDFHFQEKLRDAEVLRGQFYAAASSKDLQQFDGLQHTYEIDVLERFSDALKKAQVARFFRELNRQNWGFFGEAGSKRQADFFNWVLKHEQSPGIVGEWYGSLIRDYAPEIVARRGFLRADIGNALAKKLSEEHGLSMQPAFAFSFYKQSVLSPKESDIVNEILKSRKEAVAKKKTVDPLHPGDVKLPKGLAGNLGDLSEGPESPRRQRRRTGGGKAVHPRKPRPGRFPRKDDPDDGPS